MKKYIKEHRIIIFIIVITIIRLVLTANIPIMAWVKQKADDGLMVDLAESIRKAEWLGEYNSDTLVKGPFFPFLLALINYLGLSYLNTVNMIYILACAFFIYTIKDIIKNKKILAFIYVLLIFNPVSFASWTMQRVYRNGITLSQVLIIIGCMFALYQRRKLQPCKMLPFAIFGGLTIASLWLTREDGIWILPFVLAVTVIVIVSVLVKDKKFNLNKNSIKKVLITVLPMIILFVSLHGVRAINYHYYGVYTYNEINDGYFGKVIKTMYSIKTDEDIRYVTVSRKKVKLMAENSITLKKIEDTLYRSMDEWGYYGRVPDDGEVEDGWFWWALKKAVENSGYYSDAKTSNEFYKNVYEELQTAIREGKLQTGVSMPATLMSPWKARYFGELPLSMCRMAWYIANFEEVETVNPLSDDNSTMFTVMTNNSIVPKEEGDYLRYTQKYVKRLNRISWIYQKTGFMLTIVSFLCYVVITIVLIKNRKNQILVDTWLLLTGIGCSLVVLVAGVSYNHITSCFSRYYMYLSGSYPLLIAFWGISIGKLIQLYRPKNRKLISGGKKQ